MSRFQAGVLHGDALDALFADAKERGYAIPAVNVTGTNTANAVLEAAAKVASPVIIQLSNGGAHFWAGKSLDNSDQSAAIAGAVSAARHIHEVASLYGVPVVLHTDHAARKLIGWVDGLIEASEGEVETAGRPLFSSHMLDLSEEPLEQNVATCVERLQRMAPLGQTLEIELGITGGEEDGVDNTDVDSERLYTRPEEVAYAYAELSKVSPRFTVAAAFGNVHGVYKPGNVVLKPSILGDCQRHIEQEMNTEKNPATFVFHGGSGSSQEEIREAIGYGVVKMNIDTDTQFALADGVRSYMEEKMEYLRTQIGNPEGEDKPNKKYYDPRVWLREGEKSLVTRLERSFDDLNCVGRLS